MTPEDIARARADINARMDKYLMQDDEGEMSKGHEATEKQIEILEKAYQAVWEYVAGKADSNDPVMKALNDMQAAIISLPYDLEIECGCDGAVDRARARREARWAKKDES